MPFNEDIVKRAKANSYFREVLATGPHSQVVVMSIPPGGDIVTWLGVAGAALRYCCGLARPARPTDSRGRQSGRVLILAAGIRPDHDDRRTSGFTPER
jgi:hypothetical protein